MSALEKDAWRITFSRGEGRGRGHHRGGPQGPDVHPGRRRGPRERGRPRHPGADGDARGDQLHGQACARPDLPGADPRAGRAARPAADGAATTARATRPPSPSRSRRARASPPASPPPTARAPSRSRSIRRAGRRTSSRPATSFRWWRATAACWCAPAIPRRRSISRGCRASPGRRDLRDHERRRHDGPPQRPDRLRPAPRPQDRHHRRPDRLSPALRFDRAAAEREHVRQHLRRRLPLRRLCEQGDDGPAHRPGEGRLRRPAGRCMVRMHAVNIFTDALGQRDHRPRRRDRGLHARDRARRAAA